MKQLAFLMIATLCSITTAVASSPNLLSKESAAKVVAYSSSYGGSATDALLPSQALLDMGGATLKDFVWSTEENAPFPHWVLFEFKQAQWLTTLVFNNELNDEMAYPGISARQVEVWASQGSKDELTKIAAFELERNKNGQTVRLQPVEARWLKFVITSNWGNTSWTEISAFAAYDDGSRPEGFAEAIAKDGKVDVYGIYFDFGSARLRPESGPAVAEILKFHQAQPAQKLLIEGHTDNIGSDIANAELSLKRAQAVIAELVNQGADKSMFGPAGYGASQPVADNQSAEGRAKNRRVTVRIKP